MKKRNDSSHTGITTALNESFSIGEIWDKMFYDKFEIRCLQGLNLHEVGRLIGPCLKLKTIYLDNCLQAVCTPEELERILLGDKSKILKVRDIAKDFYDSDDMVDRITSTLMSLTDKQCNSWKDGILFNVLIKDNSALDISPDRYTLAVYMIPHTELKMMFGETPKSTMADEFIISGMYAHDIVPKRFVGEKQEYNGFLQENSVYRSDYSHSCDMMKHPAIFSEYQSMLDEDAVSMILNEGLIDLESFVAFVNKVTIMNMEGAYYFIGNVKRLDKEDTSTMLGQPSAGLKQHVDSIEKNIGNLDASELDSTGDMYNSIQGLDL